MTKFALVTQQQFNEILTLIPHDERQGCISPPDGEPLSQWGYRAAHIVWADTEYVVIPVMTMEQATVDEVKLAIRLSQRHVTG